MATTIRETSLPDLDSFDSDLFPPEPTRLRAAYGFDDVAIVPGVETIHPDDVDLSWELAGHRFAVPFIASAMDGVVDVPFAIALGQLGGLGVLNLEGLQTRYERPEEPLAEIAAAPRESVTELMQHLYRRPSAMTWSRAASRRSRPRAWLPRCPRRRAWPNASGRSRPKPGWTCFSSNRRLPRSASEHTRGMHTLDFARFCRTVGVPVVVGNCVSYAATLELMDTGIAGLLVGVGPGAACTSREVLGIGVPQVTATMDCAAARDAYARRSGRYVPIITDGGMRTGGDVCKAFASGADAVMIGSPFAQATEAPARAITGAWPRRTRASRAGRASKWASAAAWNRSSSARPA